MTWAWTDTSSAETGSSQMMTSGSQREGAGDADALPLAAGELVRVAVHVVGLEPDDLQQLPYAVAPAALGVAVDRERLADDVAHGHPWVERGVRVLHDELHPAAQPAQLRLRQREHVAVLEQHAARGRPLRAHQEPGQRALAAAGLADQAERLSPAQLEGDPVDGLDLPDLLPEQHALGQREVLGHRADGEDLIGHRRPPRRSGTRSGARSLVQVRVPQTGLRTGRRHPHRPVRDGVRGPRSNTGRSHGGSGDGTDSLREWRRGSAARP